MYPFGDPEGWSAHDFHQDCSKLNPFGDPEGWSAHDFHQDCCKLSYEKKENKKRTQIEGNTQR